MLVGGYDPNTNTGRPTHPETYSTHTATGCSDPETDPGHSDQSADEHPETDSSPDPKTDCANWRDCLPVARVDHVWRVLGVMRQRIRNEKR